MRNDDTTGDVLSTLTNRRVANYSGVFAINAMLTNITFIVFRILLNVKQLYQNASVL